MTFSVESRFISFVPFLKYLSISLLTESLPLIVSPIPPRDSKLPCDYALFSNIYLSTKPLINRILPFSFFLGTFDILEDLIAFFFLTVYYFTRP